MRKKMEDFYQDLKQEENRLKEIAGKAVDCAKSLGADECEAVIGVQKGLSVSTRKVQVENIEFNKNRCLDIVVFKGKRKGNASTTDLSMPAIKAAIEAAINLAQYTDVDPCAGIADKEDLCVEEKELDLTYPLIEDADKALDLALKAESLVFENKPAEIKDSDGAACETSLVIRALANSHGFNKTKSRSSNYLGLTLLGDDGIKMQRGSGYTTHLDFNKLKEPEWVVKEAMEQTLGKLHAQKLTTGTYNVIFSKGAMLSLWGHLLGAIAGGAIYRKTSFLCDALGKEILPDFISIEEDPFIVGGKASANFDAEGVQTKISNLIKNGVLQEYLLSSYTARKLKLKTNGHAGGIYNLNINSQKEMYSLDEMMRNVGEGLVITDLMGQGVDLLSGNYSRGAAGFYFKDGKRQFAVEEVTIAGNLKDMFKKIALIGNDYDDRYKIKCGSVLIPEMTISGV